MSTFNQATKDKGHKMLDALIRMTHEGAIDACTVGENAARDQLYIGLGHLYMAKGVLGGVTGADVSTKSGDK